MKLGSGECSLKHTPVKSSAGLFSYRFVLFQFNNIVI
eukprot:COSAG06_NODE_3595_length_5138_cov_116.284382_5_plen_37_part_00